MHRGDRSDWDVFVAGQRQLRTSLLFVQGLPDERAPLDHFARVIVYFDAASSRRLNCS